MIFALFPIHACRTCDGKDDKKHFNFYQIEFVFLLLVIQVFRPQPYFGNIVLKV